MTETTPVGVSCNMASLLHKIISLYRANWNVRMRHVLEKNIVARTLRGQDG